MQLPPPLPPASLAPPRNASPWQRVASWLVDATVVGVAAVLLSAASQGLGALALVAGGPAYYVYLVGRRGAGTVGHQVVRLSVVDDRSGAAVGLRRAGTRCAVGIALVIPFAVGAAVSAAGMARRDDRRAWHDLASETSVVRR
ncbi:MAG: RDD family protein [Ilumatobacteraceae bacterium]